MKKSSLVALSLAAAITPIAFGASATHAACAQFLHVGANAEEVYACNGTPYSGDISGFTYDSVNNKITLENYDGGAIYFFCRGTCSSTVDMEIELIGENRISSESSSRYLSENGTPKNAAFINIVPDFTGTGTLEINAANPIAFENPEGSDVSLKLIGKDFVKVVEEAPKQVEAEPVAKEPAIAEPAITEKNISDLVSKAISENKKEESFFDTTTGKIALVAVPSILVLINMVLVIALLKKSKVKSTPTDQINQ